MDEDSMINGGRQRAFTLVELLVAMAVLSLTMVVLLGLISSATEVSGSSKAKLESGSKLRDAMDSISADFRAAVIREDLQPFFKKSSGNDAIYFYATAAGYDGKRGLSLIGYRIRDNRLERGAMGSDWTTKAVSFAKNIESADFVTDPEDPHYDVLGERVFRMETEFILKGGGSLTNTAPANWQSVDAVVVNLATIDENALKKAQGSLDILAEEFDDAGSSPGKEVIETWSEKLADPAFFNGDRDFPDQVKRGIHIRRRTFPVVLP